MGEDALAGSKKNAGLGATVVFVDESGFSERPPLRRSWSPRGETPVVRHRGRRWRRVSAIGALAYPLDGSRPRLFHVPHDGNTRTAQILSFLSHLRRHLGGRVVVVWDGLNPHRAPAVLQRLAAYGWSAERLPAYSPDLNPVEGLWSWIKGGVLAHRGEEGLAVLVDSVRRAVRRARRRPGLLLGFLAKTGLFL